METRKDVCRPAWHERGERIVGKLDKVSKIVYCAAVSFAIVCFTLSITSNQCKVLTNTPTNIIQSFSFFIMLAGMICFAIIGHIKSEVRRQLVSYCNKEGELRKTRERIDLLKNELSLSDDELKELVLSKSCCPIARFIKDIDMEKVKSSKMSELAELENNLARLEAELDSILEPRSRSYELCVKILRMK